MRLKMEIVESPDPIYSPWVNVIFQYRQIKLPLIPCSISKTLTQMCPLFQDGNYFMLYKCFIIHQIYAIVSDFWVWKPSTLIVEWVTYIPFCFRGPFWYLAHRMCKRSQTQMELITFGVTFMDRSKYIQYYSP